MKNYFFLILALSFYSCKKAVIIETTIDSDLISDNTIIINEGNKSSLLVVDSNSLIFSENAFTDSIEIGDYLISGAIDLAPEGFLRKVNAVENIDGQVTLTTETAKLNEAVEDISVSYEYIFNTGDILLQDTSGVNIIEGKLNASEFVFNINKTIASDGINSAKVTGLIETTPEMSFALDIEDFTVTNFNYSIDLNSAVSLALEVTGNIDLVDYTYPLMTWKLKPITIWAGVVPIVVTNWIVIYLKFDGSISASIEFEVSKDYNSNLGIAYSEGEWSNTKSFSNSTIANDVTVNGEANGVLTLAPRYELRFYGLPEARAYFEASGYIELIADFIPPDESCNLKWGIAVNAVAQLDLLGIISEYSYDIYEYEQTLLSDFCGDPTTYTDIRDGNVYPLVELGGKIWFGANLNYDVPGTWCYDDVIFNCSTYGKLYDWNTATIACPPGWHLATKDEWQSLFDSYTYDELIDGGLTGFNAKLGGYRSEFGPSPPYYFLGLEGHFWTSTEFSPTSGYQAFFATTGPFGPETGIGFFGKDDGMYVRCVKD